MAEFRVVVGTYAHQICGVVCRGSGTELSLTTDFAYAAHEKSVRGVAISGSGRLMASASTDDTIKLYDLLQLKEMGTIVHHQGDVMTVAYFADTHLISGSEDGTVCIWRSKDYECMKVLKSHKGVVTDVAIHPSGKMALSVARDKYLNLWNLVKGKVAFSQQLPTAQERVCWSADGEYYACAGGKTAYVFDVKDSARVLIDAGSYINGLCFTSSGDVVTGCDNKVITLWSAADGSSIRTITGHTARVKCVETIDSFLVSASSDGDIKIWTEDGVEVCSKSTSARITCMAVGRVAKKKAPVQAQVKKIGQAQVKKSPGVKGKSKKGKGKKRKHDDTDGESPKRQKVVTSKTGGEARTPQQSAPSKKIREDLPGAGENTPAQQPTGSVQNNADGTQKRRKKKKKAKNTPEATGTVTVSAEAPRGAIAPAVSTDDAGASAATPAKRRRRKRTKAAPVP